MDDLLARAADDFDDAAWHVSDEGGSTVLPAESAGPPGEFYIAKVWHAEYGAHIARHDPARVLAEVEAKRRVVDECAYWEGKVQEAAADPTAIPYPSLADRYEVARAVLRALGTAYADHPEFREEWKP